MTLLGAVPIASADGVHRRASGSFGRHRQRFEQAVPMLSTNGAHEGACP
jgi:hypothetical protein